MTYRLKRQDNFTLIEATIVLFIIGLLMLLILPNLTSQREQALKTHKKAMVHTVQTQVDLYQNDHPEAKNVTLTDLLSGHYLTEQQANKINDLHITVNDNVAR